MKAFASTAIISILAPLGYATAQGSLWHLRVSPTGVAVETISVERPAPSGGKFLTQLNIGFGPRVGCLPEFSIAVLKGDGFGKKLSQTMPPNTDPINLMIDNIPIKTVLPVLVRYDNGWEAVLLADEQVVLAFAAGTTARIQMMANTPVFEFPITGARAAMIEAQEQCKAYHRAGPH